MVGVGWKQAAVYRQVSSAAAAASGAAAAAAAAVAGAADEVCFEQVQLLEQLSVTPKTPLQLDCIPLLFEARDGPKQLHLAQPPPDPATGKRPALWYIARYNKTWVEVAAALVMPEGALLGASTPSGGTPGSQRVGLAGTPGSSTPAANRTGAAGSGFETGANSGLRRSLFGTPVVAAAAAAVDASPARAARNGSQQHHAYGSQLDDAFSPGSQYRSPGGSQFGSPGQLGSPLGSSSSRGARLPKLYLTATGSYGKIDFLENVVAVYNLR